MKNVGKIDKIIRIIIGVGVLSLLLILEGNARFFGLLGLIPILTAVFSFCPLYALFGIRTCPLKEPPKK